MNRRFSVPKVFIHMDLSCAIPYAFNLHINVLIGRKAPNCIFIRLDILNMLFYSSKRPNPL